MPDAINYTELLDEFDGDTELIDEIIEMFLEDMLIAVEDLRQAVAANDADAVRQHAHKLKGSAVNVGAMGVHDSALVLENMGRDQQLSGSAAAFAELEKQAELTKRYAEQHQYNQ